MSRSIEEMLLFIDEHRDNLGCEVLTPETASVIAGAHGENALLLNEEEASTYLYAQSQGLVNVEFKNPASGVEICVVSDEGRQLLNEGQKK